MSLIRGPWRPPLSFQMTPFHVTTAGHNEERRESQRINKPRDQSAKLLCAFDCGLTDVKFHFEVLAGMHCQSYYQRLNAFDAKTAHSTPCCASYNFGHLTYRGRLPDPRYISDWSLKALKEHATSDKGPWEQQPIRHVLESQQFSRDSLDLIFKIAQGKSMGMQVQPTLKYFTTHIH